MFRTGSLSIIKGLALYTQQSVHVIQVVLTLCCVYSARLLMMDRESVRNM
jgi:hypothetical protein